MGDALRFHLRIAIKNLGLYITNEPILKSNSCQVRLGSLSSASTYRISSQFRVLFAQTMLFHVSRSVFAAVAVLLALVVSVHAAGVQPRGTQSQPPAVTVTTTTTTSDLLNFTNTNTDTQTRTLPTMSPPVSSLNGTVTTSTTTYNSSVSSPTSKATHTTTRNQTTTTASSNPSTTTSRKSGATSLRTNMFFGTTTGLISMGLGALGVGIAFIAQATLAV